MRSILTASTLLFALAAPHLAAAEELSFSAGASLVSTYVSNGVDQTDGPAFQPWIEGSYGGLYFGAWLSTLDKTLAGGDSLETDLYLGYRGDYGALSYDLGYFRYFYNESGNCCGELIASLGVAATPQLELGLTLKHDPSSRSNPDDAINAMLSVDYALSDTIGLFATFGTISKGGHDYWSIGASYALNDAFGLSLAWHDTNQNMALADGKAVFGLDYAFDWK